MRLPPFHVTHGEVLFRSQLINDLLASGIEEDAARDLIIQGFLNLKEQNLPDTVREQVQEMIAAAKSGSM